MHGSAARSTLLLLSALHLLPSYAHASQSAHGDGPAPVRGDLTQDAKDAMARYEPAEGLGIELVATEPLLRNPVVFTIDRLGRFYVVESYRVHHGVTDMREHMDWMDDELAIRTVADRVAMYRKHTDPSKFDAVYGTEEDRVVRILDTDGDGVLDESQVFTDGYADPADGIAAGFLARVADDGSTEAWFTNIPSVYRVFDRDGDGVAEEKAVHSTGYGLRVSLLGHDMHGLVIGPDGRMYWSIGDRGYNVSTDEGRDLVAYGSGAVFRCELDGSNLELFCTGLRNPQELVFDEAGRLFTLDNNSDAADRARWTYLLEGSDSGWRQAYQYVGHPVARGPWVGEGLWKPHFDGQAAYVLPPVENISDGPSGICAYPGTGWSDDWNGAFFVCDFRGNPGYSGIRALWNRPEGAGFALGRDEKPVWQCLPTDAEFGTDGRLYWTDWISGWGGPGKGRIYALEPDTRTDLERARIADTKRWMERPLGEVPSIELAAALGHADRRVRQRAQLALAARALDADARPGVVDALVAGMTREDAGNAGVVARRHAAWCAAHIARTLPADAEGRTTMLERFAAALPLALAVGDPDAPLAPRVDVALALGRDSEAARGLRDEVTRFLSSAATSAGDGPTRHAAREAVAAWGRLVEGAEPEDLTPATELLSAGWNDDDPWLRHACVRAIERAGGGAAGWQLLSSEDPAVRTAAVVVLRRAGNDGVGDALSDPEPRVRAEAARAIYDVPITGALEALAAAAPRAGDEEWTVRRILHANRSVADAKSGARLVDYAAESAHPVALRAEALRILARWDRAEKKDGIVQDHRLLAAADPADVDAGALLGVPFAAEVAETGDVPFARALLDVQRTFGAGADAILTVARARGLSGDVRTSALDRALARFGEDPSVRAYVAQLLDAPTAEDAALRLVALRTLPPTEAAGRLSQQARADDGATRRGAVRVLGSLGSPEARAALVELGAELAPTEPALVEWLEVTSEGAEGELAEARSALVERITATADDPLLPWRMCAEGGDVAAGEQVFLTKAATGCTRCHAWNGAGGKEAGPNLLGVGARLDRNGILRSIVRPNDDIAEGFQSWLLVLDDGEVMGGRIVEETDEFVAFETKDPETNELVVYEFEPSEIVERRRDVSAMPSDISKHLSRRELRDLVAFLASLGD